MKTQILAIFILSLIFTSSTALNHRVRVFLKTSGSSIGNTVDMRTNVRFNLPGGGILSQNGFTTGLPASNQFPGFGEVFFDRTFTQDPRSVLFTITEDDGIGTANDDGVCRFLAQPPSWPVGQARFDCLRESTNGLDLEWHVIMIVDSS